MNKKGKGLLLKKIEKEEGAALEAKENGMRIQKNSILHLSQK